MVFKPIWLDENYYTPLEEIEKKINNKKQIQRLLSLFQSTSESRSFYHRNTLPSSAISSPKKNFKLKIAIIICSIILILLILFLILYFSLKKKDDKEKEERCIKYEFNDYCLICKENYLLAYGKCINYSFIALYNITDNTKDTQLLYDRYSLFGINAMKIENKIINATKYYKFNDTGIITVYFYLEFVSDTNTLNYMFLRVKALKEIIFNKELNNYKIYYMEGVFRYCENLEKVDFNEFNGNKVEDVQYLFDGCYSLKTLNFSEFRPKKLQVMRYMFMDCKSLTILDLSNFNTEFVSFMEGLFLNCHSLVSLNISNFNLKYVEYTVSMFSGCISLTSLNLSHLRAEHIKDMSYMFYNCSSLNTLILANIHKYYNIKMEKMFYYCNSLSYLDIFNIPFVSYEVFNVLTNNCTIRTRYEKQVPYKCKAITK